MYIWLHEKRSDVYKRETTIVKEITFSRLLGRQNITYAIKKVKTFHNFRNLTIMKS